MTITYKIVVKDKIVDKVVEGIDHIDAGRHGIHAFRDGWNFFIPFSSCPYLRIIEDERK